MHFYLPYNNLPVWHEPPKGAGEARMLMHGEVVDRSGSFGTTRYDFSGRTCTRVAAYIGPVKITMV